MYINQNKLFIWSFYNWACVLRNIDARKIASLICENLIVWRVKQLLTLHKLTPTSDATSQEINFVELWSISTKLLSADPLVYTVKPL